jgi:hypothetical protein
MAKKSKSAAGGDETSLVKTYEVVTPVHWEHERYELGETIELEEHDAAPLLAVKAIKDPTAKE